MFCAIMETVEPWYVSKEISPTIRVRTDKIPFQLISIPFYPLFFEVAKVKLLSYDSAVVKMKFWAWKDVAPPNNMNFNSY